MMPPKPVVSVACLGGGTSGGESRISDQLVARLLKSQLEQTGGASQTGPQIHAPATCSSRSSQGDHPGGDTDVAQNPSSANSPNLLQTATSHPRECSTVRAGSSSFDMKEASITTLLSDFSPERKIWILIVPVFGYAPTPLEAHSFLHWLFVASRGSSYLAASDSASASAAASSKSSTGGIGGVGRLRGAAGPPGSEQSAQRGGAVPAQIVGAKVLRKQVLVQRIATAWRC